MTEFVTVPCFDRFMEQLEMDFDFRSDPTSHLRPLRYRFTKDALVIDYKYHQLLFGLWNRLHGFWRVDAHYRDVAEIVPHWRPLNDQGVWSLAPDEPCSRAGIVPGPGKSALHYEANAAFVAYFDAVPKRIRRLVGCLEDYQWLALDLIWQVPEFATFLDDEIHEGRIQYFYACCALADAERISRTDRRSLVNSMMRTKRHEFLSRLTGRECAKSSVRNLYKLGSTAFSAECYRALLRASGNPVSAKALAHAPQIKPTGIAKWMKLPKAVRLANLLRIIIEEPEIADEIGERFGPQDEAAAAAWRSIGQSLSEIRTAPDLDAWCLKWKGKHHDVVDFPDPPIEGGEPLRPLASAQDMKREAREMRNCLDELISSVLGGKAYFYHWDGPQRATVMLEARSDGGWYVSRILGPGNAMVRERLGERITRLVEEQLSPRASNSRNSDHPSTEELISCIPTK